MASTTQVLPSRAPLIVGLLIAFSLLVLIAVVWWRKREKKKGPKREYSYISLCLFKMDIVIKLQ